MAAYPPGPQRDATNLPPVAAGTLARQAPTAPGRACTERDAGFMGYVRRVNYVNIAWDTARDRYAGPAILQRTGKDFYDIIQGLIPGFMIALGVMVVTTLVGAGVGLLIAVATEGAGSPLVITGAQLGARVGIWILNWFGLGFLLVYVGTRLSEVGIALKSGVDMAWHSCGNPAALDAAASKIADSVAIFFSLLLQALVAYATKEGFAAAMEKLSATRYGARFALWLRSNRIAIQVNRVLENVLIDSKAGPPKRARVQTALEFFEKHRARLDQFSGGLSEKVADKWTKAIDFSSSVTTKMLTKGQRVIGYANPDPSKVGNFYAKIGAGAENLGIVAKGRQFTIFEVVDSVEVLETRTAGLGPDGRRAALLGESPFTGDQFAEGGNTQFIVPDPKVHLREIKRGWHTQDGSRPADVAAKNLKDVFNKK